MKLAPSRLRAMASDPRNVLDMALLLWAATAIEEHAEMSAILRQAMDAGAPGTHPETWRRRVSALLAQIEGKQ